MQTTQLAIPNDNNRLACGAFIVIDLAPARGIAERELSRVYSVPFDGKDILVMLVDLIRLPFGSIDSSFTFMASGQMSYTWKREYKERRNGVTDETAMAVYFYKRLEE